MSAGFTQIELERLPYPEVIKQISFEEIFQGYLTDLKERDPNYDALIETDPAIILLQVMAYREFVLRQKFNDVAKSLMLAYAIGNDLDHIAALFGVKRVLIKEGDSNASPPVEDEFETDENLRRRTQLSLEGHTTAGSEGSYAFWALSTESTESGGVKDIDVSSGLSSFDPTGAMFNGVRQKLELALKTHESLVLEPAEVQLIYSSWNAQGHVYITVLARKGSGQPNALLLDAVFEKLNGTEIRPLTDYLHVQGPTQLHQYTIDANLFFYKGPDPAVVKAHAIEQLQKYVTEHHKLGHNIELSGVYGALQRPGVQRVELFSTTDKSFMETINVINTEAAFCERVDVYIKGIDE